jgi:thiol-disulfide isomerase/thioredoxin
VSAGLIALLAAIVVALLGGAAWRQTNGRMRVPRGRQHDAGVGTAESSEGNGVVSVQVAAPAVLRRWTTLGTPADELTWRKTPGTSAGELPGETTTGTLAGGATSDGQALRLTGEQIGSALGERATLVQFSSAFCAPCRATRRILADVADMTGGVEYVEIDAESRLDLVRRLNVLRTPTVLVLDADGGVVRRASGQPRKADVIAAIGAAVGL